jgi:hypothetical protein
MLGPSGSASRSNRSRNARRAPAVRAVGSDSFAHWTWAAMLARMARCSGVSFLGILASAVPLPLRGGRRVGPDAHGM